MPLRARVDFAPPVWQTTAAPHFNAVYHSTEVDVAANSHPSRLDSILLFCFATTSASHRDSNSGFNHRTTAAIIYHPSVVFLFSYLLLLRCAYIRRLSGICTIGPVLAFLLSSHHSLALSMGLLFGFYYFVPQQWCFPAYSRVHEGETNEEETITTAPHHVLYVPLRNPLFLPLR